MLAYFQSMVTPDHCFYEADIKKFLTDAGKDRYLEGLLSDAYDQHQKRLPDVLRRSVQKGEQHSWRFSLPALAEAINGAAIDGKQRVILEGIVQTSEVTLRRIDALLLGANNKKRESALIWELKRWNPSNGFQLDYASQEGQADGMVKLLYDDEEWEEQNPLLKIPVYRNIVSCRMQEVCGDSFTPRIGGYAYFHNCTENIPTHWRKVLKSWRMKHLLPKNFKSKFPPLITGNNSHMVTEIVQNEIGTGGAPQLLDALKKIMGFRRVSGI